MASKSQADQAATGVFLIGLAVLFMTGFWWPGILFVIGFSSMARGVAEGRDWYSVPGGLWMIGLGLMFWFGFSWPLLLIFVGVSMLLGKSWQSRHEAEAPEVVVKQKREEKPKNDAPYYIDESEPGDERETTIEDLLNAEKHDRA